MRKTLTFAALLAVIASSAVLADENWDKGVAAFQAKKFTDAAVAFQAYVESVPDAYQGHQMLGLALLSSGQAAKAVPHLQKANELKSGDPQIQLYLGRALLMSGRDRDACGVLGRLREAGLAAQNQTVLYQLRAKANCGGGSTADLKKIAEAKNDGISWAAYGVALLNAGDIPGAVAALDRAAGRAPNDAKIRKSLVSALVREAFTARGSAKDAAYQKAIRSAQKLVQLDSSYDNQLLLGEMQLGGKDYTGAVSTLKAAVAKNSRAWLPQYYLGQAYTAAERYDQALPPLNQALQLATAGDDKNKVHKQLGFVYEKQKDYANSILNYERSGDSRAASRVRENQEIEQHNKAAEEHNRRVDELEKEQDRLKKEMQALPGGPPPPRR